MSSGTGTSNSGKDGLYVAGDQRNTTEEEKREKKEEDRFHEGKENSHVATDSKDERSIKNKLAREEKREHEQEQKDLETEALKKDATLPAKMHGNKPSKGAILDQELRDEEAEILAKKGSFGPAASNN